MLALPIIGMARSGSTYLTELLLTNPRCGVGPHRAYPYENRWLVRMTAMRKFFRDQIDHPEAAVLGRSPVLLEGDLGERILTDSIRSMYDHMTEAFQVPLYVEKVHSFLTADVLALPLPMRPIFLFRDPRQIIASMRVFFGQPDKQGQMMSFKNIHDTYEIMRAYAQANAHTNQEPMIVCYKHLLRKATLITSKASTEVFASVDYALADQRSQAYGSFHRTQIKWEDSLTTDDLTEYNKYDWSYWDFCWEPA